MSTTPSDDTSVPEVDPLNRYNLTDDDKAAIRAWLMKLRATHRPWSDRQIERVLAAMRT